MKTRKYAIPAVKWLKDLIGSLQVPMIWFIAGMCFCYEANMMVYLLRPQVYVQLGRRHNSLWVPVDSPQNQLAPTNSPHICANSPQPTRPTFIPTRPT